MIKGTQNTGKKFVFCKITLSLHNTDHPGYVRFKIPQFLPICKQDERVVFLEFRHYIHVHVHVHISLESKQKIVSTNNYKLIVYV